MPQLFLEDKLRMMLKKVVSFIIYTFFINLFIEYYNYTLSKIQIVYI